MGLSYKFLRILFSLSILVKIPQAALPPKGKTQVITQTYFAKPSKILQQALEQKKDIQSEIFELQQALFIIDQRLDLTDEQKTNFKNQINREIDSWKGIEAMIPDSKENHFIIQSLEHSFHDYLSLGVKGIMKKSKFIGGQHRIAIETKLYSQIQAYSSEDAKQTKFFILQPFVILIKGKNLQTGSKVILERFKQDKKMRTKILQLEASVTRGQYGLKYDFGMHRGLKFKNNFLIMMQCFTEFDLNNPIKIYRAGSKQQVSIIKDNYDKGISWQVGLFNYTAPKFKLSLYSGFFISLWRYF